MSGSREREGRGGGGGRVGGKSYYMYIMYYYIVFFFNDTATTEIYTLSLHDALPICKTISVKIKDQKFLVKKKRFSLGAYLSRTSKP